MFILQIVYHKVLQCFQSKALHHNHSFNDCAPLGVRLILWRNNSIKKQTMKKNPTSVQIMGAGIQCIGETNSASTCNQEKSFLAKLLTFITLVLLCTNVFAQTTWVGGTSSDWFTSANWSSGVPTSSTNVSISSGASHMPSITASGAVCKNLTLNSGATLSMNGWGVLDISGNWINSGTFVSGGGFITFDGSLAQSISGATTFDNLYISNSAGISLNDNITVKSTLNFENGNINTSSNIVTIDTNGVAMPTNGFVDGNLKQYVPSGFGISIWFTVGSGTDFTPLDMDFDNISHAGYITVSTIETDHPYIGTSAFNDTLTVNRYWHVTNSGVTFDQYTAELEYETNDQDRSFNDSTAQIMLYSGGKWNYFPNGANTGGFQSTSYINLIGDIAIGNISAQQKIYYITPVYGAQAQTLNLIVYGSGFNSNTPSLDFGTGITTNSVTVSSDTIAIANITISSTATLGTRTVVISCGNLSGSDNFTVNTPLPTAGFSANTVLINCNVDNSVTFTNSSSNADSYYWDFGIGASPSIGTTAGPFTVYYSNSGLKTIKLIASKNGENDTIIRTNYIQVNSTSPATPDSIAGPRNVCSLLGTNQTYTCSAVAGSTSYNWSVPSGTTLVSGQGTTSITLNIPSTGFTLGNLSVSAVNGCGASTQNTTGLSIYLPTPAAISGPSAVCGLQTSTYSIASITGAGSYNWVVPANTTILSGQGTTSISLSFANPYLTDSIMVQAISSCSNSSYQSIVATKPTPAIPNPIYGPTDVCSNVSTATSATYYITAVIGADSYNWTAPANSTILSGQGTTSISVMFGGTFSTGNVSVQSVTACASSAFENLTVTKTLTLTPGTISGPTNICSNISTSSPATFSIASVANADSYYWTVPTNASILSGQGTTSISVSFTGAYTTGAVAVQSVRSCGSSTFRTLTVTKVIPAVPGVITGITNVCSNVSTSTPATYSISSVTAADSYNWTIPANATILSGQGTTSISVLFSNTYSTGNVSVQSVVACGGSAFKNLAVTKVVAATPGVISGSTINLCPSTNYTYSIASISTATSYNWAVPTGASIISGQGTTSITINYLSSFVTGTITVQSLNECSSSALKTLVVSKAPPMPGIITGLTNICTNVSTSTPATYSIAAVTGADSYNWTVPANATILSGQGTTSISVSFNSSYTTGNIAVQSVVLCGSSTFKTLAVTKVISPTPGTISGTTNVCTNISTSTPASYSIAAVTGADSYNWTVPANATLLSGQGTTSISVSFSSSFTTGSISVQSVVSCGASAFKSLIVTKVLAATPGAISGTVLNLCPSTDYVYSISSVSSATSYNWNVPAGATIISGQGTTSITVNYLSTFVSGTISVQSLNDCSTSGFRTLIVAKAAPTPGMITGSTNICSDASSSTPVAYSISAVTGATSYNWTVPANASIVLGQGTTSISVLFSGLYTTGNIAVQSLVTCGNSSFRTLAVTKKIPVVPSTITGSTNICSIAGTSTPATYSIAAVTGADSYNWTVPANASIISGQGTTSISVTFASGYTSGNVSVQSVVACGSSAFKSLAVSKKIPVAPSVITGSTNVCSIMGSPTPGMYSIPSVTDAVSYNWTIPANTILLSGQGTTSINVAFESNYTSGNIAVQTIGACGNSAFKTLAISKTPIIAGSITGNTSICSDITLGNPIGYSVAPVNGATTYNWTVPVGATITSGAGTNSISVVFAQNTITGSKVKVAAANTCASSATLSLSLTTCHSPNSIQNLPESSTNSISDLYPNPSVDFFNVDINTDSDKEMLIEIFDITGNKITEQKHSLTSGGNTIKTDFDKYSTGIYFVKLTDLSNNYVETKKIIKHP